MLDVNNIYLSSKNHAFDPYEYLSNIPHRRVGQIHIAGHSKFEKFILDTHDQPVLGPVWKMYAHAIQLCGHTATLLEWDDRIPSFDEVHNEAFKANRFLEEQATRLAASDPFSAAVVPIATLDDDSPFSPSYKGERDTKNVDRRKPTSGVVNQFIKENDALSSFERLEIYNRQYWFRVLDCFLRRLSGPSCSVGGQCFSSRRWKHILHAFLRVPGRCEI